MRAALPFALREIDSDNGSECINAHLLKYCRTHDVQFTRGRPCKKDDNAHIEQKNWTHVRKLMGDVRYDSAVALQGMNAVYADLRLLQNLFPPSVTLQRKRTPQGAGLDRAPASGDHAGGAAGRVSAAPQEQTATPGRSARCRQPCHARPQSTHRHNPWLRAARPSLSSLMRCASSERSAMLCSALGTSS